MYITIVIIIDNTLTTIIINSYTKLIINDNHYEKITSHIKYYVFTIYTLYSLYIIHNMQYNIIHVPT